MSEFFAKIGDFFVDTWNNNPQYIWIAAAVLVVLILVIVICCVVSSKRKKAKKAAAEAAGSQPQIAAEQTPAPAQADEPAQTAAPAAEEESAETAAAQETAEAPAETAEEPVAEEAEESESAAATAEKEQPSGKKEENTVKEQKPASSAAGAPKSAKNPSDHSAVYHVTRRKEDGKWQVKYAKGAKALKLFDTQAEAAAYARKIADNRGGSVVVHKVTGQIRKVKEKIGGDEEKE